MPRKPKSTARVTVTYASCTLLVSEPMVCPLCRSKVAAGEMHQCSSATVQPATVIGRLMGKESK